MDVNKSVSARKRCVRVVLAITSLASFVAEGHKHAEGRAKMDATISFPFRFSRST